MLGVCCSYFTIKPHSIWEHVCGLPHPSLPRGTWLGANRLQQKGILTETCQVPLGLRAGAGSNQGATSNSTSTQ